MVKLICAIFSDLRLVQPEFLEVTFSIEVKTSLGVLKKHFVGIELDCSVTLGSVTLVRVKSARVNVMNFILKN